MPSTIIYNRNIGNKRALLYLFLYFRTSRTEEIVFNINEYAQACGYKPNPRKGKINEEIKNFIQVLSETGFLNITYKSAKFYICSSLHSMNNPKRFGIIYYHEFQDILNFSFSGRKTNIANTLLLLSYIRLNCHKRIDLKDEMPEIFYSHIQDISDKLGIMPIGISSSLKVLKELQIMHSEETRRYQDIHGNWHSGLMLFVNMKHYIKDRIDNSYDWENVADAGIKWIEHTQQIYNGGQHGF